jgi:hypothetical protein
MIGSFVEVVALLIERIVLLIEKTPPLIENVAPFIENIAPFITMNEFYVKRIATDRVQFMLIVPAPFEGKFMTLLVR